MHYFKLNNLKTNGGGLPRHSPSQAFKVPGAKPGRRHPPQYPCQND